MNLRDTIRKQQENWIKKLDGNDHLLMKCEFCLWVGWHPSGRRHNCEACPVVRVLMPKWKGAIVEACFALPSWDKWGDLGEGQEKAAAARLVLADVNKIARHYHYPVREA